MISPDDIVLHLQAYLPAFTSDFNEQIIGTASVSSGSVIVNATNHALTANSAVIARGVQYNNQLASVVINNDGSTRFTTVTDHDLTEPSFADDPKTLELTGLDAPWVGVHNIESVPNRRTFEIATPAGETVEPNITNAFLNERRSAGITGVQNVASIIDSNSFTFDAPTDVPTLPNGSVSDITILKSVRVSGAADLVRATNLYTQYTNELMRSKPYLFVIMLDTDVSKDRHSLNDAQITATAQNTLKQTLLQNFAVLMFIPTSEDDVSGFRAQNKAYDEYFRALTATLLGFRFNDPDTQQNYVTAHTGNGPAGDYNSSYYIHAYNWQVASTITFDNGFKLQPNVAFRDIAHTWDINSDDMAQMSGRINLDEEPL